MSVYSHPTKPGWQMIKISHGRKGKPEYIPFHGDKEEALVFDHELRGIVDRSDPGFDDLFPEFMVSYRNKNLANSIISIGYSFKHLRSFFGGFKLRQITPSLIEQYKAMRIVDGVKKRTITVELSALSSYLKWVNEQYGKSYRVHPKFMADG